MKQTLLVLIDAEGCTGISEWKDVVSNYETDEPTRKIQKAMANDLNALLQGISETDTKEVQILDWHASGRNIKKEDLIIPSNLKVNLDRGTVKTIKQYSSKSDYAILLGMHGRFGTNDRAPPLSEKEFFQNNHRTGLGHCYFFGVKNAVLNGKPYGEAFLSLLGLWDLGIKVLFCSGSKAAMKEVKPYCYTVETKNGKQLYPKRIVNQMLRQGIKEALQNKFLSDPRPKYDHFYLEFKKAKNKDESWIDEEFALFKKLKKVGRKVYFPKVQKNQYWQNYLLIENVFDATYEE